LACYVYGVTSPPHASDTLALELEARVSHLWWLISRAAPSDLSRTAAATLGKLREDGAQRIGALAAAESVTQPTITCVVQRLERDGLVVREADPQDARATLISITGAGLAALDARSEARAAVLDARLDRLDAAQRRTLVAALGAMDALIAAAEEREGANTDPADAGAAGPDATGTATATTTPDPA
jgi:DNA-binding MarR family transcriptional regulator